MKFQNFIIVLVFGIVGGVIIYKVADYTLTRISKK